VKTALGIVLTAIFSVGLAAENETAYDRETGQWRIGWPGRVAKHDLVYLTPPGDPTQGIPLGSGDVGALCWTEGSKLILAVNKSNLWDDAAFERFQNWAADQEDASTTLRHAGRIIFDFKYPVFDVFYLSDFNGRLSLADATLTMRAAGPFGAVEVTIQVLQPGGEILCKVKNDFMEPTKTEIVLERYGSRTFSHWYAQVNRDAAIGLAGTQADGDEKIMYISHALTTGTFAMGAAVIGGGGEFEKINSHTTALVFKDGAHQEFTFASIVTDPLPGNQAVEQAKKTLAGLDGDKIITLVENHQRLWKEFWMRSLMEFGDDYYDNLWHLMMYYANASQRGASPGRFCQGLWTFSRDVEPWNFYFHWNQQQVYWPLNAAGHHDLIETYLRYRFDSLPYAKKDAKEVFKVDGAMVSDVADRRGCNSEGEFRNHTPVAEIALDFWRQYQYTGDAEFLKTRALPYLIEAANFFESLFEKGDDGLYHAKNETGYEGWIELRDCITELTYGKVLFETVLEAARVAKVELPRADKWKELARLMSPPKMITADEGWMTPGDNQQSYKIGPFKGRPAPSRDLLAAGYGLEKKQWVMVLSPTKNPNPGQEIQIYRIIQMLENGIFSFGDKTAELLLKNEMDYYEGIFPTVSYAAVFPSGLIGLGAKDTPLFSAAVNTARLYAPDIMGWDVLPIVMARLGLAEELAEILKNHPDKWQFYCNGLGHYGPINVMKPESALRFTRHRVRDVTPVTPQRPKQGDPFLFETWPFRHVDFEALGVFSTTMNEALLQSYDGVIRIAPAATEKQNARFTLHATGGFIISAEIRNGSPRWVSIRSRLGNRCRIANPWPTAHVYINSKYHSQINDKILELAAQANDLITLAPDKETWENWKTVEEEYPANVKEKTSPGGMTTLGLPRMF
jgi:alpha-L-fucosidase 2